MGSPKRYGLARVVHLRHLDEHASLFEDLIDGIPLGSDDVLVLALFDLNADLAELADLEMFWIVVANIPR